MSRAHLRLHSKRWAAVRKRVFERDGWRCVMCGRAGRLECDHKEPLQRRPGQDPYAIDGLQSLCSGKNGCHARKTAAENRAERTPEQQAWDAFAAEIMAG